MPLVFYKWVGGWRRWGGGGGRGSKTMQPDQTKNGQGRPILEFQKRSVCAGGVVRASDFWMSGSRIHAPLEARCFQALIALHCKESFTEKITSQTDLYLVILSSKTYVFEDKLTFGQVWLVISFSAS